MDDGVTDLDGALMYLRWQLASSTLKRTKLKQLPWLNLEPEEYLAKQDLDFDMIDVDLDSIKEE